MYAIVISEAYFQGIFYKLQEVELAVDDLPAVVCIFVSYYKQKPHYKSLSEPVIKIMETLDEILYRL
jgi:hypothetical protein